jgi:uncharacterized protein (TIGR01244 family)
VLWQNAAMRIMVGSAGGAVVGALAVALAIVTSSIDVRAGQASAAAIPADQSPIRNFLRINPDFCTAGQPRPEQFAQLKADGVRAVLNLRPPTEYASADEVQAVKDAGLKYFNIPVVYLTPANEQADEFLKITDDPANRPMFIHCAAGVRAGAFWLIRRVLRDHWTWDDALAEARKVGLTNAPHLETFAQQYIALHGTAPPARQ